MSPTQLLHSLSSRGVVIKPRGEKLMVDAPTGVLTPADRVLLGRMKRELIDLLVGHSIPEELPVDWLQLWDERAAIMEHDGGLPREHAEALALRDILRNMFEPHQARADHSGGQS